jgi:hypothetical protein
MYTFEDKRKGSNLLFDVLYCDIHVLSEDRPRPSTKEYMRAKEKTISGNRIKKSETIC